MAVYKRELFAFIYLVMTPKSQEFRDHADECARQAAEAATPEIKARWLMLAEQWLKLASVHELADKATTQD